MPNTLVNLARVQSTTQGQGTLTLGSAIAGFNTFAAAGLTDGQTVTYAIEDYSSDIPAAVTGREIGQGVYSAGTLTRGTVYSSTSGGAKINCSGRQHVFITAAAEDFAGTGGLTDGDYGDIVVSGSGTVLSIDSAVATTFGRSLMDDADASAGRTTLGLGSMATETAADYLTTASAASTYQPLDADLTSIAALTTAAYGRGLLETTSEANFKATVNLEIGTDVQAYDAELAAIAALTSAADKVPYFTGSGTAALADLTTFGRSLIDDATAAAAATTLGLGTGNSPQFTGIELGHASDTTIARVSAGVISVEGNQVAMLNTSQTFTQNQIIQKANPNFRQTATSGDAAHLINAVSGNAAVSRYGFWSGAAALDRWLFGKNGTAESGSDAGSNFVIYYYTDAGAYKGAAVVGSRLDGSFNWYGGQYSNGVTGGSKGAGTLNFGTLYEGGTSLAAKYGALASANVFTAAQTVRVDSAATNTVTAVATLSSTSTGTPAAGIGVALNFEAETAAGNNEIGAQISAVTTDVTSTSEDFDLVFSAMAAGAAVAERGRITSKGTYKYPSFTVAGLPAGTAGETAFASDGRKNGEGAAAGTGVLVFHDGTAWRACDTGATVAA